MFPIKFPEMNKVYVAEGCMDLPAFADGREIISCWEPTEEECKILYDALQRGEIPKIYLSLIGTVQVPVYVTAEYPFIIKHNEENDNEAEQ